MSDQIPNSELDSQVASETPEDAAYDRTATSYAKGAIFVWCIVGWIYAGVTWRVLWLPGILVFFPGIFVASLIAAIFFVPFWLTAMRVKRDWEFERRKRVGLLLLATLLKLGGFVASVVGPIGYVRLLRHFID